MYPIDVANLSVRYGTTEAVTDVSFHVGPGEIVALLGANGAGKTSTLEVLEGYRQPSEGSATILTTDSSNRHEVVAKIGVLLQDDGIYPSARPIDVVSLFHKLTARSGPEPTDLLDRVGLTHRSRTQVRRLSGGEKRRLGLALALCGAPEVLLLDEPTSGVDHKGRQLLREVLRSARDGGAAILMTTHELAEAQRLADRIEIIDVGRIVASGTPEELTRATAGSGIRFTAEPALDLTYLVMVLRAQIVEVEPGEYLASTEPTPLALAKLTEWMAQRNIMLGEVRAGRHRLEDVFDRLTSRTPTPSGTTRGRTTRQ